MADAVVVVIVNVGTNEVVTNIDMLGAVVVLVIFGEFNCALVIFKYCGRRILALVQVRL